MSTEPDDLIERLRGALYERERRIDRRERDAELRAEPRERWQQHHYAAAERLERLRTIHAHRKILDRHAPRPLMNNDGVRVVEMQCSACVAVDGIDWFNDEIAYKTYPCDDVRALASIYFPEGTG